MTLLDRSEEAISLTYDNAKHLTISSASYRLMHADIFSMPNSNNISCNIKGNEDRKLALLASFLVPFSLVVSNPPYLPSSLQFPSLSLPEDTESMSSTDTDLQKELLYEDRKALVSVREDGDVSSHCYGESHALFILNGFLASLRHQESDSKELFI